jgi:hypothetical protein
MWCPLVPRLFIRDPSLQSGEGGTVCGELGTNFRFRFLIPVGEGRSVQPFWAHRLNR